MNNIKNIKQTYCPWCFKKLKMVFTNAEIPQGICYTFKGQFFKREIKKVETAGEFHFICNNKFPVNKVYPLSHNNKKSHARLKLNNKMMQKQYVSSYEKMVKYTMWECSNDNCFYYKCIDDIENDYKTK